MAEKTPALKFTKMHALGNDFVVLDAITQEVQITPEHAKKIAHRNAGIGCDQILIVEPPSDPNVDFKYRIFNQDGSEVSQCGNGARCFAKYVRDRRLTGKKLIKVETSAGVLELRADANHSYSVAMGIPNFIAGNIPYAGADASEELLSSNSLDDQTISQDFFTLSIGNPHAVLLVDSVETAEVERLGKLFQAHADFPESVNVGFMQVVSSSEIKLRVYERGAGETLACGSGACAAVIAGINNNLLDSSVAVNLPLGKLIIEWPGPGQQVILSGPATTVFHGQIRLR